MATTSSNVVPDAFSRRLCIPKLVDTRYASKILGRSIATLKRWRSEGIGPDWIRMEGRVSYDVAVLLSYIKTNTKVASVRAAMEEAS